MIGKDGAYKHVRLILLILSFLQAWFKGGKIDWKNGSTSTPKTEAGVVYE